MRPVNPDEIDIILAHIEDQLERVHVSFPGAVNAYDPATQLADITPLIRYPVRQPDESIVYEALPVIPSCPIILPRTKKWFFALPIDVGDTVLVVTSELSFRQWLDGDGSLEYPGDLRRHHLANSYAMPSLFVQQFAISSWPPKAGDAQASDPQLVLGCDDSNQTSGGTRFQLTGDGSLVVTQGTSTRFVIDATGKVAAGDTVENTQGNWVYDGPMGGHGWCQAVEGAINKLITRQSDIISDVNNITVVGEASAVGIPLPVATGDPVPSDVPDPPDPSTWFFNK